jgi:hypothetical protein
MHTFRTKRADIRKCAVIAAFVAAGLLTSLEIAGTSLTGSYAGVGPTLAPVANQPAATAPASVPR